LFFPAPGSPSYDAAQNSGQNEASDSEDDPLDAFMEGIDNQFKKDLKKAEKNAEAAEKGEKVKGGFRDDIDGEDVEESYYRSVFFSSQSSLDDNKCNSI